MVRLLVVAAPIALAGGCAGARGSFGSGGGASTEELRAAVASEVAQGFSGSVLVARGDRILLDEGFGSERGVPMRRESRFWIASVAKAFVSAAVLRCAERGLVRLDDPIARFFPDAPGEKRAITILQLLTHRSGLAQDYEAEAAATRDEGVRIILRRPLAGAPGVDFRYANDNYLLATAIVEEVTGRSFHAFAAEELWSPAGMRDTGFAGGADAGKVAPARGDTPSRLAAPSWTSHGVFSTTGDLWRWYDVGLRPGRILLAESVERMFSGVAPIGEGQVALGWYTGRSPRGARLVFTRGNEDFGANALIYAYPETKTVIVVLSHAGQAPDDVSWSRRVHRKLEALLGM